MPTDYAVPAETPKDGIPYQNFDVPTDFAEDVSIQAAEAKPGSRSTVHHIVVFVQRPVEPGEERKDRFEDSVLAIYTPGDMPTIFPDGIAKKVPKGSKLIFQMHYTPNGMAQTDRSSVALIFARGTHRGRSANADDSRTRIRNPAGRRAITRSSHRTRFRKRSGW